MLLITGGHLKAPDDARTLTTALWQLGIGRTMGLYILSANGEDAMLGVAAQDEVMEERAADMIAGMVEGVVHSGEHIPGLVTSRRKGLMAVRLYPKAERLHEETWRVWISSRVDPLKMAYREMGGGGPGSIVGVGLVVRSLWNERYLARMTVFAAGDDAEARASVVVGSYARVGAAPRQVWSRRRAIEECLSARVTWPWAKIQSDEAALFWHPPYEAGVLAGAR